MPRNDWVEMMFVSIAVASLFLAASRPFVFLRGAWRVTTRRGTTSDAPLSAMRKHAALLGAGLVVASLLLVLGIMTLVVVLTTRTPALAQSLDLTMWLRTVKGVFAVLMWLAGVLLTAAFITWILPPRDDGAKATPSRNGVCMDVDVAEITLDARHRRNVIGFTIVVLTSLAFGAVMLIGSGLMIYLIRS